MEMDLRTFSGLPFLNMSREWVRKLGLSISDMLSEENREVQLRAVKRVEDALEGNCTPPTYGGSDEYRVELLSYPLSRYMVGVLGDPNLIKWYSHSEAVRAGEFLSDADDELLLLVGCEVGLSAEPISAERRRIGSIPRVQKGIRPGGAGASRTEYSVRFTDYLPIKRHISGPEWDLINMRLKGGRIVLNRHQYIRALLEAVRAEVETGLHGRSESIKGSLLEEDLKSIRSRVERRKKRYEAKDLGRISVTRLPPCMRQILGMSQAGENLPHHARFALVAFLNGIGMSNEAIFNVFTQSPDFKEDMVRYQVDHITGATSMMNYSAPGCDTMKSGGICFNPDQLCGKEWMNHPLKYYRIKGSRKRGNIRREDNSS